MIHTTLGLKEEDIQLLENMLMSKEYQDADAPEKFQLLEKHQLLNVITKLNKLHIVSMPKLDKPMFINWHTNKFYPEHTMDALNDFLLNNESNSLDNSDVLIYNTSRDEKNSTILLSEQLNRIESKLDQLLEIIACTN